jgi:hypothetical protein
MAIDTRLVDKRIIRRTLEQSKVDATEYGAWLDALPDRSDRVAAPESETPREAPPARG